MKKHVAVFTIVLSAVAGLFALGFLPRAAEAVSKSEVDASLLPLYNYSPRVAIEYAKGAYAYVNLGGQIFTSDANAPQGASGGNSSRLGFIFKSKVPGTRELRDNEGKRVLGYVFEKEHLNTVPLYKVHDVHYTSAITSKTGELYYYRSDWNDAKDGPFVIGSTEKLDLFLGYIYPQEGVIPENLDETSRGGGCSVSGRAVVCKDVPDGGVCHADGRNPLGDSVPTYECSDSSTCSANTCVPDKGMQKAGQIVSLPSTVTTMGGAPVTVANSGSEAWGMDTYAVGMLRIGVSESPRYYPVSVEAGASAQIWVYPDVEGTYYVFLAVRKSAARAYEPFGDRRTMVVEKGAAGSFPRFSKDVWYEGLKFTWPELNANDLGKNQAMQVRDAVTDRLYFEAPRGEQSAKLGSSIPSGKRLLALAVYDYDKGGVVARGFVTPTVLKDPKAPRLSSLSWNADEPSTWPTLSTDEELPPFVSIGFVDASTGRRYELPQRAQSGTIPVSPKSGQATLKLQTFDDANVLAESTVTVAVSGSAPEAQTGGSVSSVDPSKKLTISSTAWDADDPATWPTISLAGVLPTEVVTVTDMNNNIIARGSAGQSTIKLSRSPQVPDNNYARQTIAVSVDNGPTRVFLQVLPVTVNGHYQVDGKTVSISSFTWSADDPSTWPTVSVGNLGSNEEVRVRDGETFAQIALLTQSKSSMKIASSPSAGKKQVQFLFYKKDSGASNGAMGVLNVTVTSGAAASVSTAPAAAPAQAAQTAPSTTAPSATTAPAASIAAPSLSTTSWYADDPSTWPTVSTPSSLNSNQSIRVKDVSGNHYYDKAPGASSKKIASSPAAGTHELQLYVYDYAKYETVATRTVTVTVSVKTPAPAPATPAAAAPSATTAPAASIAAPSLSTTSWYADDPSTWPTVSTPSSLNSNQSIRVKDVSGSHYFDKALGANSKRISASPIAGIYQMELYVYDYEKYETVASRTVTVNVSSKAPVATPVAAPLSPVAPAAAASIQTAPAAPAAAAPAPAPASVTAPSLSTTSWYADDPSTWPTVSTPTALNSNQSMRVKDIYGNQYYDKSLGTNSKKLASSPTAGTAQLEVYVFDYSTGAVVASRSVTATVLTKAAQAAPATPAAPAATDASVTAPGTTVSAPAPAPASVTAPSLSTTSWYADDPSTWPTVSTPTALNSNQSMRVKDGPGAQYLDKTLGTNSKKLTASPAPGTYQLDVYVYDYAAGATVATRSTTVTVSSKPAAAAAPAAPAPASIAAPSLSATTWYADDPSTWPTVSTPSSLNSNQSIRVKDGPGNQYYNKALGASSGRLTASPAPGTYQLDVYVFDYSIGAVAATRNVTVEVLGPQANSGKGFWANAAGVFSGLRRVLGSLGVE